MQAQAGLAELELAHRRGELVEAAAVRKADEHVMLVLRDRLLAIPTACAAAAAAAVEAAHRGGERAAAIYTLIETAKLNGVDPQAWLADVLARLPDHPVKRIDELLPWNWRPPAGPPLPERGRRLSVAAA